MLLCVLSMYRGTLLIKNDLIKTRYFRGDNVFDFKNVQPPALPCVTQLVRKSTRTLSLCFLNFINVHLTAFLRFQKIQKQSATGRLPLQMIELARFRERFSTGKTGFQLHFWNVLEI